MLVIANTLFQQCKRWLYTWTSLDGQYWNQIDYILCSQRWRSSIESAKTRPGADCGSDPELLIAKFRLKAPVLWPPHAKSWLIGKDFAAGRDWEHEEKGMTEDEMAGWHHWLDGHESEWPPGSRDGQGGLVCCDSWGRKELDMTEQLKWNESS